MLAGFEVTPRPGGAFAVAYKKGQSSVEQVIAAVRACLDQSLTVARSTHIAPFRGDEVLRRCRAKLARFFGAQPVDWFAQYPLYEPTACIRFISALL